MSNARIESSRQKSSDLGRELKKVATERNEEMQGQHDLFMDTVTHIINSSDTVKTPEKDSSSAYGTMIYTNESLKAQVRVTSDSPDGRRPGFTLTVEEEEGKNGFQASYSTYYNVVPNFTEGEIEDLEKYSQGLGPEANNTFRHARANAVTKKLPSLRELMTPANE